MQTVPVAVLLPITSDVSLVERAQVLLRASGHPSLSRLHCQASAGVVELQGNVPSYYLKQLAQTLVLTLSSGQEVRNLVQVP